MMIVVRMGITQLGGARMGTPTGIGIMIIARIGVMIGGMTD